MKAKLKNLLSDSAIDLVCLLASFGLFSWVIGAVWGGDGTFLEQYSSMFPVGGPTWWAIQYLVVAAGLLWVGLHRMHKTMMAFFGLWISMFWGWQIYIRINTLEQQATNSTSVFMVFVGLILFWRGGKR